MSETKTIDMSVCIGTDTLCEHESSGRYYKYTGEYFAAVAQNIWQSTANNIVIPEGLICDVQYIYSVNQTGIIESAMSGNDLESLIKNLNQVTAIRVTGIAQGWAYAWQQDQRGGE